MFSPCFRGLLLEFLQLFPHVLQPLAVALPRNHIQEPQSYCSNVAHIIYRLKMRHLLTISSGSEIYNMYIYIYIYRYICECKPYIYCMVYKHMVI